MKEFLKLEVLRDQKFGPEIQLLEIDPPTVELFYKGDFLKEINEYEFGDLRVQIKLHEKSGYSVRDYGEDFPIDKDGRLKKFPEVFDLISDQLTCLLHG